MPKGFDLTALDKEQLSTFTVTKQWFVNELKTETVNLLKSINYEKDLFTWKETNLSETACRGRASETRSMLHNRPFF